MFLVEVLSFIRKECVLYGSVRKIFTFYWGKIRLNFNLFDKIFCEIFLGVNGSNDVLIQNSIATIVIQLSLKPLYLSNCSFE